MWMWNGGVNVSVNVNAHVELRFTLFYYTVAKGPETPFWSTIRGFMHTKLGFTIQSSNFDSAKWRTLKEASRQTSKNGPKGQSHEIGRCGRTYPPYRMTPWQKGPKHFLEHNSWFYVVEAVFHDSKFELWQCEMTNIEGGLASNIKRRAQEPKLRDRPPSENIPAI